MQPQSFVANARRLTHSASRCSARTYPSHQTQGTHQLPPSQRDPPPPPLPQRTTSRNPSFPIRSSAKPSRTLRRVSTSSRTVKADEDSSGKRDHQSGTLVRFSYALARRRRELTCLSPHPDGLIVAKRVDCSSAGTRAPSLKLGIDPRAHRRSKTIRSSCPARVNLRREAATGRWRYSLVEMSHTHDPHRPLDLPPPSRPRPAHHDFVREHAEMKLSVSSILAPPTAELT